MFRIALNEEGTEPEAVAEFNIGQGVADDQAGVSGDFREIGLGLMKEAGKWLAAVAFLFIVRADVEAIDVCAVGRENIL